MEWSGVPGRACVEALPGLSQRVTRMYFFTVVGVWWRLP